MDVTGAGLHTGSHSSAGCGLKSGGSIETKAAKAAHGAPVCSQQGCARKLQCCMHEGRRAGSAASYVACGPVGTAPPPSPRPHARPPRRLTMAVPPAAFRRALQQHLRDGPPQARMAAVITRMKPIRWNLVSPYTSSSRPQEMIETTAARLLHPVRCVWKEVRHGSRGMGKGGRAQTDGLAYRQARAGRGELAACMPPSLTAYIHRWGTGAAHHPLPGLPCCCAALRCLPHTNCCALHCLPCTPCPGGRQHPPAGLLDAPGDGKDQQEERRG